MNSWESDFPADVSLLETCRASIIEGATHLLLVNLPDAVSREEIDSTPLRTMQAPFNHKKENK